MNIPDHLIDQTGLDWKSLLEEWTWLLPPAFRVWLLKRTEDLFITSPDGSIHMLDVGTGTLQQVAKDRDDFCARIEESRIADDWLMIPIVNQLMAAGVALSSGQCDSFRKLPILGGTYTPDNRGIFPLREHFGAWGSLHRQIANLPDGTEVVINLKPL